MDIFNEMIYETPELWSMSSKPLTFEVGRVIFRQVRLRVLGNSPLGLLCPKISSKFVVKDTSGATTGSEGSVTYSFGGCYRYEIL